MQGKRRMESYHSFYTDREKRELISDFLKRRKTTGISLADYSVIANVPRYTMRDWYRDPRYNPQWQELRGVKPAKAPLKSGEEAIRDFIQENRETGISMHSYAAKVGIPYYTLRYHWRNHRNGGRV